MRVVDMVSSSAQFPLTDAAALEAALGGANAAVALGAEQHKASEVQQIPADFFPIACREDLFTKLAFLRSANGDQPEDITTTGRLRTDPPPPGAGSQSRSRPHGVRAGRNAPSATPAPG